MAYNSQKQFTIEAEWWVHEAKSAEQRDEWQRRMRRELDREHRLRDARQDANEKLAALQARRKTISAEVDAIVARQRKVQELKRLELIEAGIEKKKSYNPLREIPLLDFLAPPTKVEQIVLEGLVDNYEFALPNKVDRCGTCHIGSFRVGFEAEKFPTWAADGGGPEAVKAFEEGFYRFVYDMLDQVMDGRPSPGDPYAHEKALQRRVDVHHEALRTLFEEYDDRSGEIGLDKDGRKKWARYKREDDGRWVRSADGREIAEYYRGLLLALKGNEHWLTHPHFNDMVGSTSPHPYETVGCSTCHLGRGWSTDFGYAWHGPDREKIESWMTTDRAHDEGHHLPKSALYSLEEAMRIGALTIEEEEAWTKAQALPEGEELAAVKGSAAYAAAAEKLASLKVGWVNDDAQEQRWADELGRTPTKLKYWIWPQPPLMLVEAQCLKCHTEGLYETAQPEYEHDRIGRPDPDVPDTFDWQDHALVFNRGLAADPAVNNRIFIPDEPEPYRPRRLERGLENFVDFGCYGCHKIDAGAYPFMENVRPKAGPPLDEIAAKVNDKAWLRKWVRNPKDFREDTKMPRFWGLSNNSHDFTYRFAEIGFEQVDGEAWAEAEIYAVSEWLWQEGLNHAKPDAYEGESWKGGDAEKGKAILLADGVATEGAAKACIACHDIGPATTELYDQSILADAPDPTSNRRTGWTHRMARRQGPNLAGVGSKVKPGWLFTWLKNPRGYWHDTNMPDLRLTDQEARDVVAYLLTLKHETFDALPDVGFDRALIDRMAQELKVGEQKEPTKDALNWVADQRQTYDTDPRPASEKGPDPLVMYVGSKLVKHYGCFGCHTIDAYKDATPIGTELTEWGSKLIDRLEFNHAPIEHTHFDFAYTKLVNPRIYDLGMPRRDKPYDRLKMPRFGFTPDEARDISTFLVGLVDHPIPEQSRFPVEGKRADILRGRKIVDRYNCKACHVIEGEGGDIWPGIANVKWRPPDLLGQGLKTQPAWLFKFFKDPTFVAIPGEAGSDRVRPWHSIRMPTFHFTDEESRSLVKYFAALSGAPADFESAPDDGLTGPDARYDKPVTLTLKDPDDPTKKYTTRAANRLEEARMLFQELQCKSCHTTAGDPATQAPDFRHTRQGRLREEWIEYWLWNPSKLQPGTAMPTFFANDRGPMTQDAQFFADGPPDRQPDRQIRALRDYIRYHYREEDR